MLTIDKSHSIDSDIVIISCATTQSEMAKDVQKLAVAITRAKKKLVVVGDIGRLAMVGPVNQIIEIVRNQGWIQHIENISDELEGYLPPT